MVKKILLSVSIFIIAALLCLLLYPYVFILKYGFPVVKMNSGVFQTSYEICQDKSSKNKVYVSSRCGDDSCFEKFYDASGHLVESGEFGPGTLFNQEPKIQTKNCLQTTQLYFKIKTQ